MLYPQHKLSDERTTLDAFEARVHPDTLVSLVYAISFEIQV